ncbi:hypothetical protein D7Y87_02530 [Salmonella enterica]|nr:hypothetical protein [Salmonella enterica subsp. enterica serovar Orientalis]EAO7563897.1 hypothetical protein [Salmonella enterica]EDU9697970.1 hypothetical protein [Salmonella enterica subsp. enterica]EAS1944741.1 hypothetical protein [Salmonella enterica]EAX1283728.1 hypothetical protein [Salmonella enterica]
MGKNSKSKRDLKKKKSNKSKNKLPNRGIRNYKDIMPQIKEKLTSIYTEYNFAELFLTLSISELWLPNISSPVKHTIAFNTLLSMNVSTFNNQKELKTYQQASEFFGIIYNILPDIPQMEDFVPEQDWGQIRIPWRDNIYRIFYGSSVERLYDYIQAFGIRYAEYPIILKQMENVLILQDKILSSINPVDTLSEQELSPGHVEIPSETFWETCHQALNDTSHAFEQLISQTEKIFIKKPGQFKSINSVSELSNIIMEGVALPAIGINIDERVYPLSFRNMANVIIEHYASQKMDIDCSDVISNFISQRFENIIERPFLLLNQKKVLPYRFSGILEGNDKFYLFVPFDTNSINKLKKIEEDVFELFNQGEWALSPISSPQLLGIRNGSGKQLSIDDIEFIFINSNLTTAMHFFEPPQLKYSYHILFLTEFIALFDSIDNLNELSSFFSYLDQNKSKINSYFISIIDKFASFKGTHSVLEDGAINFNMITLDPHWGSNWRYEELEKYWSQAPSNFPEINVKWNISDSYQGNTSLISKSHLYVSWSTEINNCGIHFCADCKPLLNEDRLNGQLLTLFLECACDALSQRKDILENTSLQDIKRITVHCAIDKKYLVDSNSDITENFDPELFTHVSLINKDNSSANIKIHINLPLMQYHLNRPQNASFQADVCIAFLQSLSQILHIEFSEDTRQQIINTGNRPARMAISSEERTFDTLETKPKIPEAKHFKLARKTLANLIKESGVQEGNYELQKAKDIINPLADFFREKIHATIRSMNREHLLQFIIENYDAYVAEDHRKKKNIILSLQHEVNYNRTEKLAKQSTEFNRMSANYRYLLECTLSLNSKSETIPATDDILQLLADTDWLIVLYNASDILHNDIDVGGLSIDNFYIPQVFFSEDREIKEDKFSEEQAGYKLGYNLNDTDSVESDIINEKLDDLDRVFQQDLGFKYSSLLAVFSILFQWARFNQIELNVSYQATKIDMVNILLNSNTNLVNEEVEKIIDFLILNPNKIRKLLGTDSECFDVPISDHNKRDHRYNIRPLIETRNKNIIWGSAAAYRAGTIWIAHIANGYLPAEFEWSHISHEVGKIKESIEKQLEITTFNIVKRFATQIELGIDFKKRFPKKKFPDVGDFDTLAYFSDSNTWLNIECKYNQPYYCIKDMRRLREKIFGRGDKRGQIGKIEKRINFLAENYNDIRTLLNWNEPADDHDVKFINLYISRQTYWWLRYPPYETNINFVQVDALEAWLQENL